MPKTVTQLYSAEQYDKDALDHLSRAIESEVAAEKASVPADRERYGEIARKERKSAIDSLEQARIVAGPDVEELKG
ncbi:MAG: hypothetical protein ACRD4C_01945 [Candidatus Acidiferrales bacterium]